MSDIVDRHAGRMNMQTFSAIQTVKHYLLTRSTDALTAFKYPNPRLIRNMFSAAGAYKATKKAATKKAEVKLTSKAAFKPPGGALPENMWRVCAATMTPIFFQTACHWMTPFLFFTFYSHLMTPISKMLSHLMTPFF